MRLPDPDEIASTWANRRPFPHLVLDGVFSKQLITAARAEFPIPNAGPGIWHTFDQPLEWGKQEASADCAGPAVRRLHEKLASRWFTDWLSRICDRVVFADPLRTGGGIHQSGPGARLGLHVDFNVHPERPDLVRAVNVIVFLTYVPPSHEGQLELGLPDDPDRVVVRPTPGRLVVFESSDESWHGHPVPMADHATLRKSVPAYYYRRLGHDDLGLEAHSTRFWEA